VKGENPEDCHYLTPTVRAGQVIAIRRRVALTFLTKSNINHGGGLCTMDTRGVLWTIYVIVAGMAMVLTYREQIRNGHRILADRAAGILACAAWPLVFPLVYVAARGRRV
jgi:hypothetical protein